MRRPPPHSLARTHTGHSGTGAPPSSQVSSVPPGSAAAPDGGPRGLEEVLPLGDASVAVDTPEPRARTRTPLPVNLYYFQS